MKPEDFRAATDRPLTGAEYLASLRDDREIYIYGDRVKDCLLYTSDAADE